MSEERIYQQISTKSTSQKKSVNTDRTKQSRKKKAFVNSILLFEKLHRDFLEQIKQRLDTASVYDINHIQALIIYNIAYEKLTVTDAVGRGCYLGSNISYNLKKLTTNGYVIQTQSERDKRASMVELSEKGIKIYKLIDDLFDSITNEICEKYRDLDVSKLYEYLGMINKILYDNI